MQPWQLDRLILQADDCRLILQADDCCRSLSRLQLLDFLSCFINQNCYFLVGMPTASAVVSCSMLFICFCCSSGFAAVTQLSLSFYMNRILFRPLNHEVGTLVVSLSGDLSSWEEA